MSVLIKGMEMPKGCASCPLCDDECFGAYKCEAVQSWGSDTERASGCPLIPVPPHGRLIDASEAYDKIAEQEGGNYVDMDAVGMGLDETPTVIPASEEE